MTVTLDVVTGKVTYTDLKGETLLKEKWKVPISFRART